MLLLFQACFLLSSNIATLHSLWHASNKEFKAVLFVINQMTSESRAFLFSVASKQREQIGEGGSSKPSK